MAAIELGQVFVSNPASEKFSDSQVGEVVRHLVERAEQDALPPGLAYQCEFTLGADSFVGRIHHDPETGKCDVTLQTSWEDQPWWEREPTPRQSDEDKEDEDASTEDLSPADQEIVRRAKAMLEGKLAHLRELLGGDDKQDEGEKGVEPEILPTSQFIQKHPELLRDHPLYPGMKLRLERRPPYRLQVLRGDKVEQEVALRSLGLLDVLRTMLGYSDMHPTSLLPRSPDIEAAPGNVKHAGGSMWSDMHWIEWHSDMKETAAKMSALEKSGMLSEPLPQTSYEDMLADPVKHNGALFAHLGEKLRNLPPEQRAAHPDAVRFGATMWQKPMKHPFHQHMRAIWDKLMAIPAPGAAAQATPVTTTSPVQQPAPKGPATPTTPIPPTYEDMLADPMRHTEAIYQYLNNKLSGLPSREERLAHPDVVKLRRRMVDKLKPTDPLHVHMRNNIWNRLIGRPDPSATPQAAQAKSQAAPSGGEMQANELREMLKNPLDNLKWSALTRLPVLTNSETEDLVQSRIQDVLTFLQTDRDQHGKWIQHWKKLQELLRLIEQARTTAPNLAAEDRWIHSAAELATYLHAAKPTIKSASLQLGRDTACCAWAKLLSNKCGIMLGAGGTRSDAFFSILAFPFTGRLFDTAIELFENADTPE